MITSHLSARSMRAARLRTRRAYRRSACVLLAFCAACSDTHSASYRGAGLDSADLPTRDIAALYRAALRGSFDIADPNLWILIDTTFLPRAAGLSGGTPMSRELVTAVQALDVVKGTCTLAVGRSRDPLVCNATRPGYAVRFSEPFALGADSVQVHMVVEQYATPNGQKLQRLRFERAYHVVRRGGSWRAVREARMPQP